MKILEQVDFTLLKIRQHFVLLHHSRSVDEHTSIIRNSLLGKSVSLICLTATASPVPQLKAL